MATSSATALLPQPALSGRVAVTASRSSRGVSRVASIRASSQNGNGAVGDAAYGGKLRLFIDTADLESWQRWLPSSVFYGVTTNPILLEKANVTCRVETLLDLANCAFNLGAEEVQIQTWGQTMEEMVSTGLRLAEISPDAVVVKIPVTEIGLQTASKLTKSGVRVTMTGVYSVHQALLAVGIGAAYAAPYLGRMIALGKSGMEDIQEMQQIVNGVQSDMRLLVASIKDVKQITSLAASGVNSFAIPVPIIEKLFQDDDTEKAAADFEEAVSRTLVNAGAKSTGSQNLELKDQPVQVNVWWSLLASQYSGRLNPRNISAKVLHKHINPSMSVVVLECPTSVREILSDAFKELLRLGIILASSAQGYVNTTFDDRKGWEYRWVYLT